MVKLIRGDALAVLKTLADQSVQTCITSPPYFGLRDYGTGRWSGGDAACDHKGGPAASKTSCLGSGPNGYSKVREEGFVPYRDLCRKCGARRVDVQLGMEPTPEAYVAAMVAVFREVRRVLRDDGTLWLNLGDSYASSGVIDTRLDRTTGAGGCFTQQGRAPTPHGLKPKDLIGIPWRVALALQADGWYLRSDIIWAKPNPMPESVRDRPTKSHEHLFLLSKSERYFYDSDAVKEQGSGKSWNSARSTLAANGTKNVFLNQTGQRRTAGSDTFHPDKDQTGRNLRDVWTIATKPYKHAHFATFPPALVHPCIKAGTSERGRCPECSAPWVRVVERKTLGVGYTDHENDLTQGMSQYAPQSRKMGGRTLAKFRAENPDRFLGWRPSCSCPDHEPAPCLVLDPFAGSGTTGAVAVELGRDFIGIDLNADYLKMAKRRIKAAQLQHA